MSENTINELISTRVEIIKAVNRGEISVQQGAQLLGITRQGLWKIRKRVEQYGYEVVMGRKRGPKRYFRVWNRVSEEIEKRVRELYEEHGVGPDRLQWLLEDEGISIHRSTVYRILVRLKLHRVRERCSRGKVCLYRKGYPGEEVQIDTTEPFGKGLAILISAIDDYTRWGFGAIYEGNTARNAAWFLRRCVEEAPFRIRRVRVDRGSEFYGEFREVCEELGIYLIRNPKRSPRKNGKVERFHRVIEEECLWRVFAKGDNVEYARYWLSRYLRWYNEVRRHGGYGMERRTPRQVLLDWLNSHLPIRQEVDVNETVILYIPGQISLGSGKTSVLEFTPKEPGKYKFSCWKGMISGIIDVVASTSSRLKDGQAGQVQNREVYKPKEIPSGVSGCRDGRSGCGGSCGGGCGNSGCQYPR